jgi:hypothetical protein
MGLGAARSWAIGRPHPRRRHRLHLLPAPGVAPV